MVRLPLRRYWLARSRNKEAFGLLMPVLERPEAGADPGLFGAALVTATHAALSIGIAPARQFGEKAVELARQLHDDRLLIEALAALCATYYYVGEPDKGLPLGQESVEHARELGDDVLLGESLTVYLLFNDLIEPAESEASKAAKLGN